MSRTWQTLVSVLELKALLDDTRDVVLFDCRHSLTDAQAGEQAWVRAHLPGAFFAPLDTVLSGSVVAGVSGRHPLPEREQLGKWLGQHGVSAGTQVVVYDDMGGAFAARLWWLLRWLGHHDVAVLDGGMQAWVAAGLSLDDQQPERRSRDFSAGASAFGAVAVEQVEASLGREVLCLLDARDGARYRGEVEPFASVAGHIPGALSRPFADNLNDGVFKPVEQLQAGFRDVWDRPGLVCYCGSGVTACHNILAMMHAGRSEVPQLYTGSWSEWVQDSARPVATGASPG